ncbi:hypothetical protein [Halalkalicoccus subterraneus]|uniref:hypothetical protein n=1 Tax=Halalkalicoccus subterraneus TaxID=2675002 RepID=UPI000EFBBABE|nr:hypothetical protein [Halalkalicoccus subterraneus]
MTESDEHGRDVTLDKEKDGEDDAEEELDAKDEEELREQREEEAEEELDAKDEEELREQREEEAEEKLDAEDEQREAAAEETANPDAHRDERPFNNR